MRCKDGSPSHPFVYEDIPVLSLDELWDFNQPAVSEDRFREALTTASGEDALVLRTQLARAIGLQRRFEECAQELDVVELTISNGADGAVTPLVRTYLKLERGRQLRSSGHPEQAKEHFLGALAEAEAAGLDHLAADAAHMMAITEPGEAQIPWARRALAIAEGSEDPRARTWIASVSHNLGWTLHDLGRFDEAQELFTTALAERERRGEPEPLRVARWTVARGLRSLGRFDEALEIQRELAAHGPQDGYVEEELAELLLATGATEQARPHFARAAELLSADEWLAADAPERLARLAKLAQN
jgi:tetratricopeptide (TPR) repeat protein